MNKNLTDDMMAVSQQDKVQACLEVHKFVDACENDGHDCWEAKWQFRKRNGPGGMTYDFGDNS